MACQNKVVARGSQYEPRQATSNISNQLARRRFARRF
ncbi:unnamed protein product [Callosobruchus maculatus]|uniref:Uncharacterized protein n=1 Tax=Callosobruchus maculatus TaxID=64391 RepID=A0A653CG92_CALMS|nr:unnamed protein product [Callosobruchus maculatus]